MPVFFCLAGIPACWAQPHVYVLPSTEQPRYDPGIASGHTAHMALARGEAEHIQVVVKTADAEHHGIRFYDPGKSPFRRQLRRVDSVPGYRDALVPVSSKSAAVDSVSYFWVTYRAAYDQKPGVYHDRLVVDAGGRETVVDVTINVSPVKLPVTPAIPAAFGIVTENLTVANDPAKSEAQMLEWADLVLDYRVNPYFSTWLDGTMKHEASSSPWPWHDKRTFKLLKDKRFNRFALPYHSLDDVELKEMLRWAAKKNLLDRAYFYLWDEPSKMDEYRQIKGYAERIHRLAPEARVLTTFYCGPKDGPRQDDLFAVFDLWRGDTDIFSMSSWALQNDEANAVKARTLLRGREEFWTYVCMGPGDGQPNLLLDMDGYQHRAVMWRNWKEQTTGFLYWAVNAYAKDTATFAFRPDLPAGDGVLIYPGHLFGQEAPVVSVRLERWRDSMEDYELLALMERREGRPKAEEMLKIVYQGPDEFTKSPKDVERFRERLLNLND